MLRFSFVVGPNFIFILCQKKKTTTTTMAASVRSQITQDEISRRAHQRFMRFAPRCGLRREKNTYRTQGKKANELKLGPRIKLTTTSIMNSAFSWIVSIRFCCALLSRACFPRMAPISCLCAHVPRMLAFLPALTVDPRLSLQPWVPRCVRDSPHL